MWKYTVFFLDMELTLSSTIKMNNLMEVEDYINAIKTNKLFCESSGM